MGMPTYDADAGGAPIGEVAGGITGAPGATPDPYLADELGRAGDEPDGRSMLDVLVDDLAGDEPEQLLPPIALRRKPDYVVVFAKITDGDVIDKARKASADKKKADGIDGPKFAALIVGATCRQILRRGAVLADDEGRPLRFNHRMLLNALHAPTVADCARKFYGDDADLDAVARKVMSDSGWGADALEVDVSDPPPAG